eukprot:311680-Alexandrium_andersonii.AAC.1
MVAPARLMAPTKLLTATQSLRWIPPFRCAMWSEQRLHHTWGPNDQQQQPKCWDNARADSESGVA